MPTTVDVEPLGESPLHFTIGLFGEAALMGRYGPQKTALGEHLGVAEAVIER
jgi:hypothetical protein